MGDHSQYPHWGNAAALHLARFAHWGQHDKAGMPYIQHPVAVAHRAVNIAVKRGMSRDEQDLFYQVGLLHDVIEDTRLGAGQLRDLGVPMDVIGPVMMLTRPFDRSRPATERYYRRIVGEGPVALIVKEADIWHNLRPERLMRLDDVTQARLRTKYRHACEALGFNYEELAA